MLTPKWNSKSVGEYERSLKPKVEDDDDIQDYKKPWVGLTEEDCDEVERWVEFKEEGSGRIPTGKLVRYIEAKLKEKNHG